MTGQQRALRWLAAGVLVLWCGGFLRAENTEKSMVRALILTPPTVAAQSWTVGLLYQFPEAAADASDAAARVQLCTGRGNTLQTALTEAERGLPRKASYRLCEYLLLNAETTLKTIRQAETVLKEEPVPRAVCPHFLRGAFRRRTGRSRRRKRTVPGTTFAGRERSRTAGSAPIREPERLFGSGAYPDGWCH